MRTNKQYFKITIFSIIGIVPIFFYLLILGGPVSKSMRYGKCKTDYTYFITNNFYCNFKTKGHCSDNKFEKLNAENSIGNCLCENYKSSKSIEDSLKLIEFVRSNVRILISHKKLMGESYQNISVKDICNTQDVLFEQIMIE